jgi:mRNA interferase HicA
MKYSELLRWLTRRGCTIETHRGGSGHVTVRRGERFTQLPAHGSRHDMRKGLVEKIKKDLGFK